jgi:pSer/pThr/pTyr-binding forkhead associated (FHA) protein
VNDPLIAQFAQACGATRPLDLWVHLVEGGLLAEGVVHQPFTLVGRDDACDVTLTDPDVNPRHAWFQAIGGRVYVTDLGSRTGLVWPNGATGCGWLDPGISVRVGPFRVSLRSPPSDRLAPSAPDANPLVTDPTLAHTRPTVQLEFRNGKRARDRWTVNRAVTLVGRSEACKIHLNADDISAYHCGLVLTPAGLWVVDLSGRGVVVNGERMRVAPLDHGSELWVGRFLIGCLYPAGPGARYGAGHSPAGVTTPGLMAATSSTPPIPEDEVPLGLEPANDPVSGLPSSHIMADAFRAMVAGPVSHPILVSPGSSPTPPVIPVPSSLLRVAEPNPFPQAADGTVAQILRLLADVHAQMSDQFQQSMLLMVQVSGQDRREQSGMMQQELARIQDLNAELARLQIELARLTLRQGFPGPPPTNQTPIPGSPGTEPLRGAMLSAQSDPQAGEAAIHDWVRERIDAIQQEQRSHWGRLFGLCATPGERPA